MSAARSKGQSREEKEKLLREKIEKKHGKSVEKLYKEREKRISEAVELKEPDRVPVNLGTGVFAARYRGLTASAIYYNQNAYRDACEKMILDFEPDLCFATGTFNSGLVLELLGAKDQRWPGSTLPADVAYQFVEGEYMRAEEYDLLLSDPSDFVLRYYLPRVYESLGPLSDILPFRSTIGGHGLNALISAFIKPEFQKMALKLRKAAREQERLRKKSVDFIERLARLGFPSEQPGRAIGAAPFDTISDYLRGMRGSMLDMYRCPDKLLAACDKILEWRIAQAIPADLKSRGKPKWQGMPLHRSSDGFMSLKQFDKFYWPTLKKAILSDVDLGYVVLLICEGIWNERLEYLLELPKGKVVCAFEKTDMFKAKEVLGGHLCIQGNVSPALLEFGSPQEVEEYCKNLIKVCGKGGGFILGPASAIDEARPQNIGAMVDSARKYGVY
jgi:uroporphyrinogen-III decarboxylase